ncbi:UNVERIFIED_CONTAM: hypothetical protein RMT77_014495 [Armadillidium vulgare]
MNSYNREKIRTKSLASKNVKDTKYGLREILKQFEEKVEETSSDNLIETTSDIFNEHFVIEKENGGRTENKFNKEEENEDFNNEGNDVKSGIKFKPPSGRDKKPLRVNNKCEKDKIAWDLFTKELNNKLKERVQKIKNSSNENISKDYFNETKEELTLNSTEGLASSKTDDKRTPSSVPSPPLLPQHLLRKLDSNLKILSNSKSRINIQKPTDYSSDDDTQTNSLPKTNSLKDINKAFSHEHKAQLKESEKYSSSITPKYQNSSQRNKSKLNFTRSKLYRSLPLNTAQISNRSNVNHIRKAASQFLFQSDTDSSASDGEEASRSIQNLQHIDYRCHKSIRLCHKNLQTFPSHFLALPHLKILDLSWNNIQSFQSDNENLSRITELKLTNNKLKNVDLRFFKFLKKVFLNSNVIEKFPILPSGKTLVLVDLTNNSIWNLSNNNNNTEENFDNSFCSSSEKRNETEEKAVTEEPNLKLKLNRNRLTGGISFDSFQNVTDLDVSENGITSLDVTSLTSLTSLRCSGNKIVTISVHGAALEFFVADRNSVTTVKVKYHPRNLQYFDISKNCLAALPPWLVACDKLEYLDVSQNRIYSLPAFLTSGHLSRLKCLKANYNKLKIISSTEYLKESSLTDFENRRTCNLEVLSLHHNSIQRLPQNFFYRFNRLRILNISSNNLQILPDPIKTTNQNNAPIFPPLQELYAADNQLTNLAPISRYQRLRILHVPFNNISVFPDSICDYCDLLEEIILSGNCISTLPSTISKLKRLTVFKIHLNPIQQLPNMSHLGHLKVIDASYCRLGLVDFGAVVGPSLIFLDMAFNPSLVVDRNQFTKCNSERSINVVETSCKPNTLPLGNLSDPGSKHLQHYPYKNTQTNSREAHHQEGKKMPWNIGFSECIGQDKQRLKVTQLRISNFCSARRNGLVALSDGGAAGVKLLKDFPKVLKEEISSTPDLNDALKYSLLSSLRNLVVKGETTPAGFFSAYFGVDENKDHRFNCRSSDRVSDFEVKNCVLRVCYYGSVKGIVSNIDGPPVEISAPFHNTSFVEELSESKARDRSNADRFSYLPDPQTMVLRLTSNHRSLIIASSNFWDVLEIEEICQTCHEIQDPALASKKLLTLAQAYGCSNALSILIVNFPSCLSRNSSMYSSLTTKNGYTEPKAIFSKIPNLYKNETDEKCIRKYSNNKNNSSKDTPERGTEDEYMDRYPPSGQSDNEDSASEFCLKKTSCDIKYKSNPTTDEDNHSSTSICSTLIDNQNRNEGNELNLSQVSFDLISPPVGFGDEDSFSIGSDSGFSGNSGEKVSHLSVNIIQRNANSTQTLEKQHGQWDQMVTSDIHRSPSDLSSRSCSIKSSCFSSVPNLALGNIGDDREVSERNAKLSEKNLEDSSTLRHFDRNPLRKSRFGRGAVKLLQGKFNFGIRSKLRANSSNNFKRYGSLQNLKYYQNKNLSSQILKFDKNSWSRSSQYMKGEMKEKSDYDSGEFESRMQHYWNSGVTCF